MKILSSIKAKRKLAKMVRLNFFRTLKIKKRLATIQGPFFKKNS